MSLSLRRKSRRRCEKEGVWPKYVDGNECVDEDVDEEVVESVGVVKAEKEGKGRKAVSPELVVEDASER